MIIKNDKLKKLLKEVGDMVLEGRKIHKVIEEKSEEMRKLQLLVQKKKDKMKPIVEAIKKENGFGKYEDFGKLELNKDGEVEGIRIDKMEEHKKFLDELDKAE